jgi:RNA polymerase sigma factor (sigma-70 family)
VSPGPFEQVVLPHLDAAYNLARWLTRSDADAEDVVQEACVRALRFFGGFRGDDARRWLLAIVRNSSYDFLRRHRPQELTDAFDEEIHTAAEEMQTPEALLLRRADRAMVRQALPLAFDVERRCRRIVRRPSGIQRALVGPRPYKLLGGFGPQHHRTPAVRAARSRSLGWRMIPMPELVVG